MAGNNYYDVTEWSVGNPYADIGEVINNIISDIKIRQTDRDVNDGGKPGAVIYIPPGDYHLLTQVHIDISYLKIIGSGHGFTSSSIRFNTPEDDLLNWHEVWPGGSRIIVNIFANTGDDENVGAAFYINRDGDPRISSVEFADFCIDGLHFVDDGTGEVSPENTYVNGKTGIYVACPGDSFRFTGMGLVYLEHGITIYHADALDIHDNFIAECGNCVELRCSGQASKITDNLMGAGYKGYTIFAENFGGLLVAANNIFPRGASSIHFVSVARSMVTGNRLHSFYPGMLIFDGDCSDNSITANHFFRQREPWPPMQMHDNGLNDLFGIVRINGNNNSVIANHLSEAIDEQYINPQGAVPVIIRVVSGTGNYISNNNMVAFKESSDGQTVGDESCFSTQVDALKANKVAKPLNVTTVLVESESLQNTILDSGSDAQVVMDKTANAFRATPTVQSNILE
jgi:hypothetical protein